MNKSLAACAGAALLAASAVQGAPRPKTGVDIYEDFIAARAAASKCLAPNPEGDLIYGDKLRRVALRTESLILAQNPSMNLPLVRSKMAAASERVRQKVYEEVRARSCSSPRISPLLDYYKRQSIRRW